MSSPQESSADAAERPASEPPAAARSQDPHPAHPVTPPAATPPGTPPLAAWPKGGMLVLVLLAGIQFAHILDFMILMPLGPRFMTELGIKADQFGLLVAAYAIAAGVSGLFAAARIDRFDRKWALLTVFAGFTLGTFACAVVPGYGMLLAARAITGIFGGLIGALALTIVGDFFPPHRRGFATGVVMSSFSIATIVGIPAGLWLASWGNRATPFWAIGAVAAILWGLALAVLPSMRGHLNRPFARQQGDTFRMLTSGPALRAYAMMMFLILSTAMMIPHLASFMQLNLGFPERLLPWVYVAGGGATLITTAQFGRLADRFGKVRVFRILAIAAILPMLVITQMTESSVAWAIVMTTLFMILTSGRMVPAMALVTSTVKPEFRGSFMSIIGSVQQLSMGLASLLGSLVLFQQTEQSPIQHYDTLGLLGTVAALLAIVLVGSLRPLHVPAPAATTATPSPAPTPAAAPTPAPAVIR
ncbi:MFS transporter [Tuwongella immobilis]|uniref:Major facilitator superfamily (MFS) profile domain-containing protein n=1 Tax=Tuwongella immobilis TaxID=692036 RepID=A0A6C2YHJ8_9BACT|nr:MFS transporter [Tuwongella immobilis]VIP00966.1 sugar transporter : Major facilitator superfamily protein OS=Pontibacter sp. BAB1700 GN=O71_22911 PE=4 SV=1: MFS_1 [Tuwongella immobilis]VTR97350.1 sugar transporter : Major facilitator superfamily protein OS=Pontibacter sp. BAB1700 GN=O71_22911 PE=4 SV=1: MFS_1 [Tuwongella immobilis]